MNPLSHVFGVTRDVPLTYVQRPYVDTPFLESLSSDHLTVVYGSSKQGKSSLRRYHLQPTGYVVVQCTSSTTRQQLYELLLKEAGAAVSVSTTTVSGSTSSGETQVAAEGSIFVAKGKASGSISHERSKETERVAKPLDLDTSDPNDVVRILAGLGFRRTAFIEDFHYLSSKVQEQVAADLKVFFERAPFKVVIVGVWRTPDKLVQLNGDLDGRVDSIDADRWDAAELTAVLQRGEELLNVRFSEGVRERLLFYSQNNIGLLQQMAAETCRRVSLTKTQAIALEIRDDSEAPSEATAPVNWHGGPVDLWLAEFSQARGSRYARFLRDFAMGPAANAGNTFRYIAGTLVKAPHAVLCRGVTVDRMVDGVMQLQVEFGMRATPTSLPPSPRIVREEVLHALIRIPEFNEALAVQPPILEFDANQGLLQIVDSGFLLHHAYHSTAQLLESIGLIQPRS